MSARSTPPCSSARAGSNGSGSGRTQSSQARRKSCNDGCRHECRNSYDQRSSDRPSRRRGCGHRCVPRDRRTGGPRRHQHAVADAGYRQLHPLHRLGILPALAMDMAAGDEPGLRSAVLELDHLFGFDPAAGDAAEAAVATPARRIPIQGLVGFVLQAYFAARIAGLFTQDAVIKLALATLLTFAPPLLWRLAIHYSLVAHWLILAAIYLYWAPVSPRRRLSWVLL